MTTSTSDLQKIDPKIDPSWKDALAAEFQKPYFQSLKLFLKQEKEEGHSIYPPGPEIFAAFNLTPLDQVKVVILGQDPYHGKGQANGLSFSVSPGVPSPPSLKNIFKELESDIPGTQHISGDLSSWAKQGVFLLNAILTVRAKTPASHQKKGWEIFTDAVIKAISEKREHCVFILWGNYAKGKIPLIDSSKHLILTSAHPSPYSAENGFFGSKPFSKTNEYLLKQHIAPIEW